MVSLEHTERLNTEFHNNGNGNFSYKLETFHTGQDIAGWNNTVSTEGKWRINDYL